MALLRISPHTAIDNAFNVQRHLVTAQRTVASVLRQ